MALTRRGFRKGTAAGLAGAAVASKLLAAEEGAPRIRLSACDWSLQAGGPGGLDVAKRCTLDGLEVSPGGPADKLQIADPAYRQQFKDKMKETGIAVSSLARGMLTGAPLASDPRAPAWVEQTIEAARQYAEPESKYLAARDEMARLQKEVEDAQRAYEAGQADKERQEIARRLTERRQQIEEQKQESIRVLFTSAEQLRKERRFAEAADQAPLHAALSDLAALHGELRVELLDKSDLRDRLLDDRTPRDRALQMRVLAGSVAAGLGHHYMAVRFRVIHL